jgi:opacity protein-like surface antigen
MLYIQNIRSGIVKTNKLVLSVLLAMQTSMTAYAGMNETEMEKAYEEATCKSDIEMTEAPYYVVLKDLYTLGDDVREGEAILDGDNGAGAGIDLGYRLGNGFALEFDLSYERNTVTERREGEEPREADADFYTAAIDVVYTYEVGEALGVFAKAGFEREWADLGELGSENDNGAVFGAGFEYAVDETYKFVMEYEHSTIDSARGDGIFAGVMINFD